MINGEPRGGSPAEVAIDGSRDINQEAAAAEVDLRLARLKGSRPEVGARAKAKRSQSEPAGRGRQTRLDSDRSGELAGARESNEKDPGRFTLVRPEVTLEHERLQQQADRGSAKIHSNLRCRIERNLYLAFEHYRHYTCANCYK